MYNSINVTELVRDQANQGAAYLITAIPGILLQGAVKVTGKLGGEILAKKAAAFQARQKAKAEAQRQAATANAIEQYKQEKPHEVQALEEQKRRIAINKALDWPSRQQQYMIDYLVLPARNNTSGYSAYSFSKNIPHRSEGFTGSYQDLARTTLGLAQQSQHYSDGMVQLLGAEQREQHARKVLETGEAAQITAVETEYNGGVATALWQLGFIEAERGEAGIPQGEAHFNPSIEWSTTHELASGSDGYDQTTYRARLPFDAGNELHRMLAPETLHGETNLSLELEFSQGAQRRGMNPDLGGEYMGIHVVPAEVSQPMAAAH